MTNVIYITKWNHRPTRTTLNMPEETPYLPDISMAELLQWMKKEMAKSDREKSTASEETTK